MLRHPLVTRATTDKNHFEDTEPFYLNVQLKYKNNPHVFGTYETLGPGGYLISRLSVLDYSHSRSTTFFQPLQAEALRVIVQKCLSPQSLPHVWPFQDASTLSTVCEVPAVCSVANHHLPCLVCFLAPFRT